MLAYLGGIRRRIRISFIILLVIGAADRASVGVTCATKNCSYCCTVAGCIILSGQSYQTYSPAGAVNDCANVLKCVNGNPINLQPTTIKLYYMGGTTLDCNMDGYSGPGIGNGGVLYNTTGGLVNTACGIPQS